MNVLMDCGSEKCGTVRVSRKRKVEKKMKQMKKHWAIVPAVTAAHFWLLPMMVMAEEADTSAPALYGTVWALLPPLTAILLALLTKEVYSSLFLGILMGALLSCEFSVEQSILTIFEEGFFASLGDSDNIGILVFLVALGTVVCLMNKAGGSAAFGKWAEKHVKTRMGTQLATMALGVLIFIDDYFNCLTVGSVMRPVTDRHKVSRAKLAYLIDSTAAPVCIIAPISSWAAAVSGFVEGEDGFSIFMQAIPYNFYAIFTLAMLIGIIVFNVDMGSMKKYEKLAAEGKEISKTGQDESNEKGKGTMLDLVIPILVLIGCCVIGMIYTGGFFEGAGFVESFANSIASRGLAIGSTVALLLIIGFYTVRRVMKFNECMACLPEGFKEMVPAILILTFAWTLKAMTDRLGADVFVANLMKGCAESLMMFLPALIFVVGACLAFATGTSWGTFGILIPIVVAVFEGTNHEMMIISISACMAGAVCGDHCSPISDTTIMASAGAKCDHITHVTTQLPYALTVAAVSVLTYIVAGFAQTPLIAIPVGLVFLAIVLFVMKKKEAR